MAQVVQRQRQLGLEQRAIATGVAVAAQPTCLTCEKEEEEQTTLIWSHC